MKKKFRDYEQTIKFVRSLKIKNYKNWNTYCKSGNKPDDIPTYPQRIYKKEWTSWGDFLGTGRISTTKRIYLNYDEAKKIITSKNLKNTREWRIFCNTGKPDDIPSSPERIYKKEWTSWGDFLGTGRVAPQNKQYLSFYDARVFVRNIELKNRNEWLKYCKSGNKPDDIPSKPDQSYKKEWKGIGDWLGTGRIANQDRTYKSFLDAKKFVHTLKINGNKEWRIFAKSGELPIDIPNTPERVYKKEWTSWGDWLGTGNISASKMKWVKFLDAKKFVHTLNLKGQKEWYEYCNKNKKPKNIPSNPHIAYKNNWRSMGDWLGTGNISSHVKSKQWLPFNEAKKIMKELAKKHNIRNWDEWRIFAKSGELPPNIPSNPSTVYSKEKTS
jgi:hypothetical protein